MSTQNTEHTEKIYLIFSMTTTKVGKMIRRVTKYPYNHVSVSLTPDLAVIYSLFGTKDTAPMAALCARE